MRQNSNTWVAIDTNVLFELLLDLALLERTALCFQRNKFVLCIPQTVLLELIELFDIKKTPSQIQIKGWQNLNYYFDGIIKFSRKLYSIIEEELQHCIFKQPTLSPKSSKDILNGMSTTTMTSDLSLQKIKDDLMENDTWLVKESDKYNISEILGHLNKFQKPNIENYVLFGLKKMFWGLNPLSIIENPDRYKSLHIFASLGEYYAYGLMLNYKEKGKIHDELIKNTSRDRGSHHDNVIFSEAAYCEVFITDDDKLHTRVTRLIERNVIHSSIYKLKDFLVQYK